MPGIPMAVLKHIHPMLGLDLHDEVSPPGIPVPNVPHLTMGMLCIPPWGVCGTGKPNDTVLATIGLSIARGSDMGPFIPHIPIPPAPANLLWPVLFLTSGSKSHFGASGTPTPNGPIAFACLVYVGLNLNCAGPTCPPLPNGYVLALFQLAYVGVTMGDVLAGVLYMAVDLAAQFALNRLLAFAGNWVGNYIAGALAGRLTTMGVRLATIGVKSPGALIQALMRGGRLAMLLGYGGAEQVLPILKGFVTGTPVGFSPTWNGKPLTPIGKLGSLADDQYAGVARSIDRLLDSPSVEDVPSQPSGEIRDAGVEENLPGGVRDDPEAADAGVPSDGDAGAPLGSGTDPSSADAGDPSGGDAGAPLGSGTDPSSADAGDPSGGAGVPASGSPAGAGGTGGGSSGSGGSGAR
jgi:hypothetical protein